MKLSIKTKYSCVYKTESLVKGIVSNRSYFKFIEYKISFRGKRHAHCKKLFIRISTVPASIISTNFQQNEKTVSEMKRKIIHAFMKKIQMMFIRGKSPHA